MMGALVLVNQVKGSNQEIMTGRIFRLEILFASCDALPDRNNCPLELPHPVKGILR